MPRPDRRTRRAIAGALVTVTALALIWPASSASGRTPSTDRSAATAADARKSDRQPTVHGLGTKPSKRTTEKRTRPLQKLAVDHANRGEGKARGAQAPDTQAGVTAVPPPAVNATNSGAPAATSFGPWEGINQATSGFEPPDPWVAVGPDDVVQTVNTRIRFTNREGASTANDVEIFDFFALDEPFDDNPGGDPDFFDGLGDPRFVYDAQHNRWLGITLAWHCDTDGPGDSDDSIGYVWGAISRTGDPTGDYYEFYIRYGPFLPDFPSVGTSNDKLAITANEYILSDDADCTAGIPYDGASVYSFDWSGQAGLLLEPLLPDGTYEFSNDWFALRPALMPSGGSNTIFLVGEKLLASPAGDTTSNVVYLFVTGTNAGTSETSISAERDLTNLGVVPAFVDPPGPTQPAGSPLDPAIVDRRPTDAIWQANVLTFVSTIGCDPAGGGAENRDCARVTQINTSTATPTRVQDMLIGTTGKDTWFPGAGVSSSGILHVVYTQSSTTEGMSSYDRYQLPSDAIHTLSAARKIADGGAVAYPGDRWGDFVGVAQDPRDTNAVWQGNQYTHSSATWATRVSQLQTAGSTFVAIPPVRVLDSRVNNGTTGPFVSSVPKTIDIAGRLGIPNSAVAITGNLTVTGQQQAGYASLTRVPDPNPATSTINFPLGDNRANNLTSPLNTNGKISITYKASTGKQAHFILDVTGYFLNNDTGQTFKTLAPVRVLDSRPGTGNIGLTGPIPANANREFDVAGVLTVPAGAVAVTGNLTVTGQTGAGFVTLSSSPPPANPTTSTINFPIGDTRANGVTIKLSNSGTIFAVYKAPPGKSTHLIFDVTGYYVADLTGARFVAVSPGRRMDTRFPAPQEGLSGPFAANTARTLVIEPYQGVPANASAITGNLTVVGQSRAGFVSMTQTATNTPTTSTINFPLGDTRANGVTGPLSGPGSVGLVYKSSGGQTHLILDITGYFR
ncbi:MAG TPA: hypothetical protein VFV72_16770 [Candidatus Limnocylindrales bacterium]|nr:hypothetical protein [Candidatus Limnocylindrales bacterium]